MATAVSTTSVQAFFDDYAAALASYSPERISDFYHPSVAIYSDGGIRMVQDKSETLDFWKEGIKQYKTQKIERPIPTIVTEEQLSSSIFISKVLWRNYDHSRKEVGTETNFYVLKEHNGELKICGLIIMAHLAVEDL